DGIQRLDKTSQAITANAELGTEPLAELRVGLGGGAGLRRGGSLSPRLGGRRVAGRLARRVARGGRRRRGLFGGCRCLGGQLGANLRCAHQRGAAKLRQRLESYLWLCLILVGQNFSLQMSHKLARDRRKTALLRARKSASPAVNFSHPRCAGC